MCATRRRKAEWQVNFTCLAYRTHLNTIIISNKELTFESFDPLDFIAFKYNQGLIYLSQNNSFQFKWYNIDIRIKMS